MQNNTILKIIILIALCSTSLFSASLSSTEIINMVSEIKKEREGISLVELEGTANPFMLNTPKKKEVIEGKEVSVIASVEVTYNLKAILNKAAFIDNKWYRQGDDIGNYKVGYVSSSSVVLKSTSADDRTLNLEKKKKKFIKLNRGYR